MQKLIRILGCFTGLLLVEALTLPIGNCPSLLDTWSAPLIVPVTAGWLARDFRHRRSSFLYGLFMSLIFYARLAMRMDGCLGPREVPLGGWPRVAVFVSFSFVLGVLCWGVDWWRFGRKLPESQAP